MKKQENRVYVDPVLFLMHQFNRCFSKTGAGSLKRPWKNYITHENRVKGRETPVQIKSWKLGGDIKYVLDANAPV